MIDEVQIGPDEIDPVRLFQALGSQWRIHPMSGHRLGIDYPAIAPTAAMLAIPMTPRLFRDVQVMEGAALSVFATR